MSTIDLNELIGGLRDANATRYFTVAGVVVLLFDHVLTFGDELLYIWRAPTSFAKCAFLLNRYLVPCVLVSMLNEMCGFNGISYSDAGCQKLVIATALVSVLSIAAGNMLILLRVLILWGRDNTIRKVLYIVYALSTCVTLALMIMTSLDLAPGIQWNSYVNMCVTTTKTRSLAAVWGAPMFFEITVLGAVFWNVISSPRSAQIPLSKALQKDGITFFLAVVLLRVFNMVFAIVSSPSMTLFAVCFVWAAVTVVLNRSLLRLRKVEIDGQTLNPTSPFGRPEVELSHISSQTEYAGRHESRRSILSSSSGFTSLATPKPWEDPGPNRWPQRW